MSKKLPTSSKNLVAAAIRKAIGASDTEPVAFATRDVNRRKGWPPVQKAPAGFAEFTHLFEMTGEQLRQLGCGNWDGGLFLFPQEWYPDIPEGFPVETINGKIVKFVPGKTDNDVGVGMLAYGVRIGPSLDES